MKHLPSFALLVVTALTLQGCASAPSPTQSALVKASAGAQCRRLAQPGDQKIQIYCSDKDGDFVLPVAKALPAGQLQPASVSADDTSCRLLTPRRKVCGTTAEWDQFDTRAVARGVTCRVKRGSVGHHPAEEICRSTAQWESSDHSPRRTVAFGAPGSNWPGNSSTSTSANPAYATSYGYFPQGTSIGATAGAPPPR
jgi:hypothetical protein